MSEEIKPDNNGHEPSQEAGKQQVKVREVVAIAITDDNKVLVKGKLVEERNLILTALGEAIKIVANFEKPAIVKPDFRSRLRRFLPNKKN